MRAINGNFSMTLKKMRAGNIASKHSCHVDFIMFVDLQKKCLIFNYECVLNDFAVAEVFMERLLSWNDFGNMRQQVKDR